MGDDPAYLLDVTRLVSRLGQGPLTGIDRVEAAWLARLQGRKHLLIARLGPVQAVLPPDAGAAILRWIADDPTGLPSCRLLDRVLGRTDVRSRAKRALVRGAVVRGSRSGRGLRRAVGRMLGAPVYLNVGHSNLDGHWLSGLGWARPVILVHDTIPLDHPEFTRAGQGALFRARLHAALRHASTIATVSASTRDDVLRWRDKLGVTERAPVILSPIGTTLADPVPSDLPPDLDLKRPFFLTLGTIEPRKNHALLLDVWDELARQDGPPPQLLIVGRRGWENAATFARLDALPPHGPIREMNGLSDGAVAALMGQAHALLMPSHCEGFGLPLTEAAARGTPVLSTPMPVARDLLGRHATWLPPDDPAPWAAAITALARRPRGALRPIAVPTWNKHFQTVDQAAIRQAAGWR